ncbi:hypothetical protein [Cohnella hashimotonis]|uniref:DUF1871 family protein n=1 Tax=Cohnella hashimotonis TaxID=2826895 RepID=A0ABT6TGV4_9BACL|nr:hypothetical protein [Cohnella hashimotonis]MDI4645811.1 hypothetical protein [Cohnella hashimotonis]
MWEHPSNTQVKNLKKQYDALYMQLEPIVNEWDPIGLINGGAPKDEYDCITVQLISLLQQGRDQKDIFEFIIHELDDHFGMGIETIKGDYKERFIKKHRDFSIRLVKWYSTIINH